MEKLEVSVEIRVPLSDKAYGPEEEQAALDVIKG